MAKRQSLWRILFAGVVALALICSVLSVTVLPDWYTRQLIHEVEHQSGIEILPVTSSYSFLTGHLLLTDPELRITPGLSLKAASLSATVPWYAVISQDFKLSDIDINSPKFGVDLYILGHKPAMKNLDSFLNQVGRFSFQNGLLQVRDDKRRAQPEVFQFHFSQLQFYFLSGEGMLKLAAVGQDNEWEFNGRFSSRNHSLVGSALVSHASLADVIQQQFITCQHCQLSGLFRSALSVTWTLEDSLQVQGSGVVQDFEFSNQDDVVFAAKGLEFKHYDYAGGRGTIEQLIIDGIAQGRGNKKYKGLLQRSLSGVVNSIEFQDKEKIN
ncbi:hypothetical protein EOPP23_20520 [Endozoicomonas sp. OPT23]|uniref:hypothetical protein n=1 Tax=Endozoicomonas sp. OPT23 TaxID=2072845 RepID=UPI00129A632F|nr:hypothetical protein [Endozoicomonas sp. OPT23]MRI35347.1 hypothetical protein [Endozoicomonas sp. OPT23]